jgi:hypothetical protein
MPLEVLVSFIHKLHNLVATENIYYAVRSNNYIDTDLP